MAYNIKRYDGLTAVTSVEDGNIDNTTLSINLIGKNRSGYGEAQNQNFVYLLENFAGVNPPRNALSGQIWYDSTNKKLKYNDATGQNSYRSIARLEISETQPSVNSVGDLWFSSTAKQLKAWDGTNYVLIGPSTTDPSTTMELLRVEDSGGSFHNVLAAKVLNQYIYIISSDPFDVAGRDPIFNQGFTIIHEGITLRNIDQTGRSLSDYKYWGTASDSDKLGGISSELHVKFDETTRVAELNDEGFSIGANELTASYESGVLRIKGKTEFYLNANNTDVIKVVSGGILRGGDDINIGSSSLPFANIYANSATFTGTSHIKLPVGNTSERPVSPIVSNGQIRYNSDISAYEGYSQGSWLTLSGGGTGGNYHPLNGGPARTSYYLNASYIYLTPNADTISASEGSIRFNGGQLQGKIGETWFDLIGGGNPSDIPISSLDPSIFLRVINAPSVKGLQIATANTNDGHVGFIAKNLKNGDGLELESYAFFGAGPSDSASIVGKGLTCSIQRGFKYNFFVNDLALPVTDPSREVQVLQMDENGLSIGGNRINSSHTIDDTAYLNRVFDVANPNGIQLIGAAPDGGHHGLIVKNTTPSVDTYAFFGAGPSAAAVAGQKVVIAAGNIANDATINFLVNKIDKFTISSDQIVANYTAGTTFNNILNQPAVKGLMLRSVATPSAPGEGIIFKHDAGTGTFRGGGSFIGNHASALNITSTSNIAMVTNGDAGTTVNIQMGGFTRFQVEATRITHYTDTYISITNATYLSTDPSGKIIPSPSDIALKENIEPLSYGLNEILQLNPIVFNWKPEFNLNNTKQIGLIAQEVEPIIPELVSEYQQGETSYKQVHYMSIVSILTKAIQELKVEYDTIIAELRAEIANLKNQ